MTESKPLPGITNDLESAVVYFRPVLQRLGIRQGAAIGTPVFLAAFPHLWNLANIDKWVVTVLRARLNDCKAKFVSQYHKKTKIMECYIILDELCFVEAKVPKEIRKAVAVHEFIHFLALIYNSSASTTEEVLLERLKARLSKVIDELTNEQVLQLYQVLNKMRPFSDDFSTFEQTKDDHFRLNCEALDLSYSDLFKNFLLSRQMFDEFFPKKDKEAFFGLLKAGNAQEAINFYFGVADRIAKEKCLPNHFARNQAIDILMKFYLPELNAR